MRRKSKYKYLIVILLIMFISIGFAYLTSNLDIVGLGHLKRTVWKIYFDNVNILEGGNLTSTPPTTSNHNTTSVTYSVTMDKPGDVYKFNIDIVNNGTVDAMVGIIDENTILTSDQSKYASYSIKYLDGREIQEKNFLGKHSKETLQVIIKYKKDLTAEDLIDADQTLNFKLSLTYTQAKNADSRTGEPAIITDLSGNGNDGIMYGGRVNADGTVYLDGVDDFIDCGLANYDFGSEMTYVIRMKTISLNTKDALTAVFGNWKNAGGGLYFQNYSTGSKYGVQFNDGTYKNYVPNNNIVLGEWTTLVGTVDGTEIKLYKNGVALTGTSYYLENNIRVSGNTITIGGIKAGDGSYGEFTNAIISDALIFDRTLTSEEISTDYASTINPTNTSEMLLRYKFSSNGIVKDLSGNGNDGIIHGSPVINKDGSITFDGVDDHVNCGLENYDFNDSVSFIARVYLNQIVNSQKCIFGNWEAGGGGLLLINDAPRFNLYKDGYVPIVGTKNLIANRWYIIVGTYDGEKMKYYIDGKEILLSNNQYSLPLTGNIKKSPMPILLAGNPNTSSTSEYNFVDQANITVSDALIFDRAVTKEEVENDYAKTISPSNRQNLLLYYHFG